MLSKLNMGLFFLAFYKAAWLCSTFIIISCLQNHMMSEISELQDEIFSLVISVLLDIALQSKIHRRCTISIAALRRFNIEHSSAKMLPTVNKQLIEKAPTTFTDLSWPLTPCNEYFLLAKKKERIEKG